MLYHWNVDLGYEDNLFDKLDENVDHVVSLGYYSGYDASLDPYCIYLMDNPRKNHMKQFLRFLFWFFYGVCFVGESTNFLCYDHFNALQLPYFWGHFVQFL